MGILGGVSSAFAAEAIAESANANPHPTTRRCILETPFDGATERDRYDSHRHGRRPSVSLFVPGVVVDERDPEADRRPDDRADQNVTGVMHVTHDTHRRDRRG